MASIIEIRSIPIHVMEMELKRLWPEIQNKDNNPLIKHSKPTLPIKSEAERCCQMYKNAQLLKLDFMVLGETNLRDDFKTIVNLGTLAARPAFTDQKKVGKLMRKINSGAHYDFKLNSGILKERVDRHFINGSVLNEGMWHPLVNDMAMLGLIHSHKQFYLAIRGRIQKEHYWSFKDKRPTVLGRELIQLYHSQYRLIKRSGREEDLMKKEKFFGKYVFVCLNTDIANRATLRSLREAAEMPFKLKKPSAFFKSRIFNSDASVHIEKLVQFSKHGLLDGEYGESEKFAPPSEMQSTESSTSETTDLEPQTVTSESSISDSGSGSDSGSPLRDKPLDVTESSSSSVADGTESSTSETTDLEPQIATSESSISDSGSHSDSESPLRDKPLDVTESSSSNVADGPEESK